MKIIYLFIFLFFISPVTATQIPYGVDGWVTNFGEEISANISIINLNNSYFVKGFSDVGSLGRYSASINGNKGDSIIVTASYQNKNISRTFELGGLHHLNFDFEVQESFLSVSESIKIPEIKVLEVKNLGLKKGDKIRTRSSSKQSDWVSLDYFPKNTVGFAIYEDMEVDIKTSGGDIITKKLFVEGKDVVVKESLTIYDKPFLSVLVILGIVLFSLIFLQVRKK
jgi:hypothetical protein